MCPSERALESSESTKMVRKLQVTREARISKNGEGIEGKREENHASDAYPSNARGRAPLSLATERKDGELRGVRGVLSPGNEGGVKWGSSRNGCMWRWLTALIDRQQRGVGERGRVARDSCAGKTTKLIARAHLVSDSTCARARVKWVGVGRSILIGGLTLCVIVQTGPNSYKI